MRQQDLSGEDIPADIPADASILVVDDEPEIAEAVERIFRPLGPRVTHRGTVAQAQAEIARVPPDLVILDLRLPDGEGLSLCREIKGRVATNAVPVILLSAHLDSTTRLAALEAGADHVLAKPPPRSELIARAGALLRARAVSRALEEARGELRLRRDWVRYLAHDLRNALTLLVGNTSLLRETRLDPEQARIVSDLSYELQQTHRLVVDLLDTERLREGRLEPRRQATDLVALMHEAVSAVQPALAVREIRVDMASPEALDARVDADLVGRVFLNVLSNATRYADARSQIGVRIAREGGSAVISVTDVGPSVPPDLRERIFQPFVRLDDQPGTGTGLGLAFCAFATRAHGGSIAVDEPPGGGARFWIRLPLE